MHWNKLPREAVELLSLEALKEMADLIPKDMIWWAILEVGGWLDWVILSHLSDSTILKERQSLEMNETSFILK